jgi:hypothetical protein
MMRWMSCVTFRVSSKSALGTVEGHFLLRHEEEAYGEG